LTQQDRRFSSEKNTRDLVLLALSVAGLRDATE
jgi:hypothetical protein